MNQFRHIVVTAVLTLGVFSTMLYVGCKNKCGTTTCQNGGTCINNLCSCPTGYYGNSCQTGFSDASVGTYNCTRSACNPQVIGDTAWTSVISKDPTNGGFTIDITNFDNGGQTIVATIDSPINLVQHLKITPSGSGYGINATGKDSSGTIILDFTTYAVGGGGYTCKMKMVKQ